MQRKQQSIFKSREKLPGSPEHGLQMSWADGTNLVKVSEFDGHPTNGHAFSRPFKRQVCF